jgi:hypothetical protein
MLLTPSIRAEIENRILPENFYITRMEITRKNSIPDIDTQPEVVSGVVDYDHRVFLNVVHLDDPHVVPGIIVPRDKAIELVYASTFSFMTINAKVNLAVRIVPFEPIGKLANIDDSDYEFCANFVNSLRLSVIAAYLMREQAKLIGLNVQMSGTSGETGIRA